MIKPITQLQTLIICFAFLLCAVGIGLFVPGLLKYIHAPTPPPNVLSINLCPDTHIHTDGKYYIYTYTGAAGSCATSATPRQEFVVDPFYFSGVEFPVTVSAYVSKYAAGTFSLSIKRGPQMVMSAEDIPLTDTDPHTNFGVVGGGNVTIYRSSPWNLSGRTPNTTSSCDVFPSCVYYPLFSTYTAANLVQFTLPPSDWPPGNLTITVHDVKLVYNSSLNTEVMIDLFLEFQNNPSEDQTIGIYMMVLGGLLVDVSPGIAYFLWFKDSNRKKEWRKKVELQVQSTASTKTKEDTLDELAAEEMKKN